MMVVSVLDFSLLIFAIRLVVKVFSLVRMTDMPMLLSVVSIAMALLFFLIYSILLIVQAFMENHGNNGYLNTDDGTNWIRVMDFMKVMFTFCAFLFDLYKWCIFIIATTVDKNSGENYEENS